MPRKNKCSTDLLTHLRIEQEREKLLLLRMKRQDEEAKRSRRRKRDRFDKLSDALGEAAAAHTSPWGVS
ncbi:MAG: hypothetical protein HRU11_12455 [Parvularculaceae bacterium]|nr:hypothetical protein [Parvularculaceae bacterium]